MDRREFISRSAAVIAASRLSRYETLASQIAANKRVGLIGCGWYGKCDLFRLIQVAPVEVVSLCDVDSQMLTDAAEIWSRRGRRRRRRRALYGDYREMLAEKDLDIVLIATPDHWHALPMIAAVEAGADVYVQKPISVDVVEGQAMLAAARKHKRVVQVGTQRRSTPHLIEARDRIIREGKLGKIGLVEIYCYYHMRATRESARHRAAARASTTRCGPARRRCGRTTRWSHPRGWRAFMEYGNGIIGDMCIHMLDMVRWMLDLGWPQRISSSGRHPRRQEEQGQHHRHADGDVRLRRPARRLAASHLGRSAGPQLSRGARRSTATRARSKASVMGYDFTRGGQERAGDHTGRRLRAGTVPRGQDREGPRDGTSPRRSAAT